ELGFVLCDKDNRIDEKSPRKRALLFCPCYSAANLVSSRASPVVVLALPAANVGRIDVRTKPKPACAGFFIDLRRSGAF
ncbi:hypothetical protein, partial [Vogesella mureinivorans]|uniref:hypothetical protein n=1 Tax=Vogesella mureinivorans TaxID=657276 RepID=UPI00197F42A9